MEMIFEPFFTTEALGSGTGLGLASTADLVRQARGGISLESAAGEGAAFHLYFPVVEVGQAEGIEPPETATYRVPARPGRGSLSKGGSRSGA